MLILGQKISYYAEIWKTREDRRRYCSNCLAFMHIYIYGSWSIVLQYPLRGKIFYFFNSLFLTFFRYLWNRFQSETQRNARDSSTEKSKTRRRWWGEYLNIKWLEFVNNSSRGEPPATKSSEYQTTSYSVYIYELHVIVPWKQKKFQLPFAKQT